MGACAFTDVQHRDIIVFKNLRFHPSTQEQQNGVFKNPLSIEFLKRRVSGDSFLRIPVDGTPNRKKKISGFKQKRIRVDGAYCFYSFVFSPRLPSYHQQ